MRNFIAQIFDDTVFHDSYFDCRKHFLTDIEQLGSRVGELRSFEIAAASGQVLSTDAVWLGNPLAEKVIVLISGTHGVEGYCGSGIQRFILQSLQQRYIDLGDNVALLIIHALNPWGMYWARRCDQAGIDLNRNFLDFSSPPTPDDRYRHVLDAVGIRDEIEREQALDNLAQNWGQKTFDEIFSGGQYRYEWAPFYGGTEPARANRILEDIISHWDLASKELIVIDLHTGLGPFGYGELISDHPAASAGERYARAVFGNSVASTDQGESFSVSKRGLLDFRWHRLMAERGCFLTLEFGTLGTRSLFNVLLSEHLFWRDRKPQSLAESDYRLTRAAMLKHFFPAEALWRQSVLFRGGQIFVRALEYLNG